MELATTALCHAVTRAFEGRELPDIALSVAVAADGSPDGYTRWYRGGRLVLAEPGVAVDADLVLVVPAPLLPTAGVVALESDDQRHVRVATSGDTEVPVPLRWAHADDFSEVTAIPRATCTIGYEVRQTMVGTVRWIERWSDGRRVAMDPSDPSAADVPTETDVEVVCTLRELLHLRSGAYDAREFLAAGAGVTGDWQLLMLWGGLMEEPDSRAAFSAGATALAAQVALGVLIDSPGHRAGGLEVVRDEVPVRV